MTRRRLYVRLNGEWVNTEFEADIPDGISTADYKFVQPCEATWTAGSEEWGTVLAVCRNEELDHEWHTGTMNSEHMILSIRWKM